MRLKTVLILGLALLIPAAAMAGDKKRIKNARSAGPASITAEATVLEWDLTTVLAEGSNDWFCLPDNPDTKGNAPLCGDQQWLGFFKAYMAKEKPNVTAVGFSYMLQGDWPGSNTDPYAAGPTEDNDWMDGLGAHVMILAPNAKGMAGLPTHSQNGGPWVMWADTPYAHMMMQIDSYPK